MSLLVSVYIVYRRFLRTWGIKTMDKNAKIQLAEAYKARLQTQTGGIYIIKNKDNSRIFIEITTDCMASLNRFGFSKQMNTCPYGGNVQLTKDWVQYGRDAFEFEIVETINKNELQTMDEFRSDLEMLKILWLEKVDQTLLY